MRTQWYIQERVTIVTYTYAIACTDTQESHPLIFRESPSFKPVVDVIITFSVFHAMLHSSVAQYVSITHAYTHERDFNRDFHMRTIYYNLYLTRKKILSSRVYYYILGYNHFNFLFLLSKFV